MASTEDVLRAQLKTYSDALNDRVTEAKVLDAYYNGDHPYPPLVQQSEVKRAYRMLMELTATNWPQAIVDATESRLEVQGVRFGDAAADDDVWAMWQQNGLDAEAGLIHQSALTTGRGFAIVWGDGDIFDPMPRVTLEHPSLCIVEYEPGSRRKRRGALRRWNDGKRWYANLYTPEALYKFRAEQESEDLPLEAANWKRRDVRDEPWPIPNPLGEVPVVEFAINRSLRPDAFGNARGDFARNLSHIDRINYKTFSGLVALTWSGFALRYVIGDPILYEKTDDGVDDKTKPVPPFDALASAVAQLENPDAKIGQLPEATISQYSPKDDVVELAAVTSTPVFHLLPGEMVNISADAMRAGQDSHVSKVKRYQRTLGEAWEDTTRLMLRVADPGDARGFDASAEVIWREAEHRSLAETADAATKLASINMPNPVIMAKVLGMTPQEIARAEAQVGALALTQMIASAESTVPPSLLDAHIEAQRRLRVAILRTVGRLWRALGSYDREDIGGWLEDVLPVIESGQIASVALTEGYLARAMERQPLGVNVEKLIGSEVRHGVEPATVYERPFVTVWSSLAEGAPYRGAVRQGQARAESMAAFDIQGSMRATAAAVQDADPNIFGFARKADPSACDFCRLVDGAYVKRAEAMPLHNHCGCSLEPLTKPHPRAAKLPSGVAVHEHGEMGPVLADPEHVFTTV